MLACLASVALLIGLLSIVARATSRNYLQIFHPFIGSNRLLGTLVNRSGAKKVASVFDRGASNREKKGRE